MTHEPTNPSSDPTARWLKAALGLPDDASPFPWQLRLLRQFRDGHIPRALDLPTGLGKTAVMAIWLVARALGARLPRRLVYVVDRRAVVDQATKVAGDIRAWVHDNDDVAEALDLVDDTRKQKRHLAISTLRGQFADNREWLTDPSMPAIIVGTVDMVGSRLLFEGYGTSRKMRPYQAGLLGCDTLFVIDEAHLVPAFEHLIASVADAGDALGPVTEARRAIIPKLQVLSLSATGRDYGAKTFRLDDADRNNPMVARRLRANKRLVIATEVAKKELAASLAMRAWEIAAASKRPVRCIVFANSRADAATAQHELLSIAKRARGKKGEVPETELFVGGRRVRERAEAAQRLKTLGFLAGTANTATDDAFLFATSAGEVGVDLDGDHMVSDVVAWERMVQRLGRVNRRGDGDAQVHVIPDDKVSESFDAPAVLELLHALPRHDDDGAHDASPNGLKALDTRLRAEPHRQALKKRATTPEPLRPALTRPLVESWAMTSIPAHTGRPEVGPWLRGWIDDLPQTAVVWRTHLSDVGALPPDTLKAYLEATPPHLSERLDSETYRVADWLIAVAARRRAHRKAQNEEEPRGPIAVLVDGAQELTDVIDVEHRYLTQRNLKKWLERDLAGKTLIVDATLRGLSSDGLLDEAATHPPPTADAAPAWCAGRMSPEADTAPNPMDRPIVPWRVTKRAAAPNPAEGESQEPAPVADAQWPERQRVALEYNAAGDVKTWLVVERWKQDAATEDDRSTSPQEQTLIEHQAWAESRARRLGARLDLPAAYVDVIAVAGRLHDEGKAAENWQRAFNARREDGPWAKTRGPVNVHVLNHYRHEFGSLPRVEEDDVVAAMPEDLRDLVLHLVAAHHGFARPLISAEGCDDAPPSRLKDRARDVALRYVRLQEQWGPWGLAYLEALLRAADQQASRDNDERGSR